MHMKWSERCTADRWLCKQHAGQGGALQSGLDQLENHLVATEAMLQAAQDISVADAGVQCT